VKPFDLPTLDPATLVNYREDREAWKRFERRFRLPGLVGILLVFGVPIAHVMGKLSPQWVFILFMSGMLIIGASLLWMFKSNPISTCGRPMKKYWNSAPQPGNDEVIYVCEASRTYFIRVWGRGSRSALETTKLESIKRKP
jgi:hypothetical protein